MKRIFLTAIIFQLCFLGIGANAKNSERYVIILSLDGFRWDYSDIYNTPVLDSIAANGVKAQSLMPCFPSKTFPNHYSIATGLFPNHHGIIGNNFYNSEIDRIYKVSDRYAVQDSRFYSGEPFWVTASNHGIITASYYWIGSETKIKGKQPDIWKAFDSSISFEQRIDSVISWLQFPANERPHLISFYFEQPDKSGHLFGPESKQTRKVVERIDSLLGVFCLKKNRLVIADFIDLIIVSDHGMGQVTKEKSVALKDHIPPSLLENVYGNNPFFLVESKEMYEDSVFSLLSGIEGINVWKKNDVPDTLQYGTNENISSLVVCAKKGWGVYMDSSQFVNGGTHGYSFLNKDMHGIFYGIGPSFNSGIECKSFQNIEVYNIVCKLLNIEPAPNDGKFSNVSELLKQ
ncbi:ectonucleotide pyrophosphatase/phosphodiesterase [Marinilabilia salmonicolor]|jgi:alkaline phosphatase D|uniref:Alkaline phosphatase D n=1 Tax=Marinilabilia salmonicolor TaxID=989 RepID=A0A2T0XHB0_9BACT|nr:ectonucleotide pyrophosphatase/phosphodiesterase [Marinilabilia salmonicolor]PRY98302.1 alkaline phosphatase D [Marinilabilia salmonicolor]RCW33876.1 alkaline phosphatase D [Marinilabilia salmonicolor]